MISSQAVIDHARSLLPEPTTVRRNVCKRPILIVYQKPDGSRPEDGEWVFPEFKKTYDGKHWEFYRFAGLKD